jgi:very-short-patch-repair endonuclease
MCSWTDADYKQNRLRVEELQRRILATGIPRQNPFWGVQRTVLLPSDERRLPQLLQEARALTESVQASGTELANKLHLQVPRRTSDVEITCRAATYASDAPNLKGVCISSSEWQARRDDLARLIQAGARLSELHNRFDSDLIVEAWNQNLVNERQHFVTYGKKWWRLLSGNYRRARACLAGLFRKPLPTDAGYCLIVIDAVLEARKFSKKYRKLESLGGRLFGAQWQGETSDWSALAELLEWIVKLYKEIGDGQLPNGIIAYLEGYPKQENLRDGVDEVLIKVKAQRSKWDELTSDLNLDLKLKSSVKNDPVPLPLSSLLFSEQLQLIATWLKHFDKLIALVRYNVLVKEFQNSGLGFILPLAESWEKASNELVRAYDAAWYAGLIETAYAERPMLNEFDRDSHEHTIRNFRKLDRLLFEHNRIRLAQLHWQKLPNLQSGGELAIIRREINKKRRHLPIRRLIEESGRAIQAMKPVFMMSPMSIARFLPPGAMDFDLVIFDEASQVKPVDAFGAILRGKQVVVVGDSKQLPPTSFFDTLAEITEEDEEEVNVTAAMESILGLFGAQNAPERMFRWHYRSRNDSLIAVSNHEFYGNRLLVFPSPGVSTVGDGLVYHHIPRNYYDRGGTRANPEEARIVAEAVMEHARTSPNLTLGVAAFSIAQRDVILAQIELMRRRNPSCEQFFNSHANEPFFVKNLENVQGDERDIIFISVGYGKTKEGFLSMSFGPLNREGGERRLNVLITRARETCRVFANFVAEDLDLERTPAQGVRSLRTFLAYARNRTLDVPQPTNQDAESAFEEQVARALTSLEYKVSLQVGSAGFRVDIGIRDESKPGRYLLGIECDGATYHSACSARDRDRLRQEVLEGLGWRIYRIWSSDWFRNPEKALKRAVEAIEQAKIYWTGIDGTDTTVRVKSIPKATSIARGKETQQDGPGLNSAPYQAAAIIVKLGTRELHQVLASELAKYVENIADIEGPVHREVVIRRVTTGAGVQRAGNRIQKAINKAISAAARSKKIQLRGNFVWPSCDKPLEVRDRSVLDQEEKKLEFIAPEEIALALEQMVIRSYSVTRDEAITRCLNRLGFSRTTGGARRIVEAILTEMLRQGRILSNGDVLKAGA